MLPYYRLNVGICILNKDKKIFLGKRSGVQYLSSWQMPQGGVSSFEEAELEEGMFRELYEEIGLKRNSVKILQKTKKPLQYNFPEWVIEDSKKKGIYPGVIGQKQIWFLLSFLGENNEINLNIEEKPEFVDWTWSDVNFAINNVVEMKKKTYISVFEEFNLTPIPK